MLIIFDLDGTLIDSARDLEIAVNQTRANFGFEPLPAKLIQSYVGNGAATLVRRAFGPDASEQFVSDALMYFVKYYRSHALANTRLYPGIHAAVDGLIDAGHKLAVLTNKPVRISRDILAGLEIGSSFVKVYGGDSFEQKKPDPVGILTLMGETGMAGAETWMVGDSGVDVRTARNAGVRVCGVKWGFQPETLEENRPDALIEDAGGLLRLFGG